ncbi:MAG TPA: NUDIX hydrolase [Kofleriaceae bacterium]|nr:NUDIX hydrolase [Kofleriaceae bacterium]
MSEAPIVGVSAVVFDDAGRVLVVERGKPPAEGMWSVPGGRVEPGETLAEGVAREVREETGLDVEVGPLIDVLERASGDRHYQIHPHVARLTGGTLVAGSDARAARWVTDDELAALPTTEGLADVIAKARRLT